MAFEHVRAGQRWQPKEFELNAVLDAGAAHAASQGVGPPGQTQGGVNIRPVVVRVRNATASTVQRYRGFSLGNAQQLLTDGSSMGSVVCDLVAYAAERVLAVTQQAIPPGGVGQAVISGHTIIELDAAGDAALWTASPQSSGVFRAQAGPVRLSQRQPSGGGFVVGLLGGGGSTGGAQIVWTPAGGIPAATLGTNSLTLGSASCLTSSRSGAVVTPSATNLTVYNTVTQAIGGSKPVQCKLMQDGIWAVDVEICTPGGDLQPPILPNSDLWDEDDLTLGL